MLVSVMLPSKDKTKLKRNKQRLKLKIKILVGVKTKNNQITRLILNKKINKQAFIHTRKKLKTITSNTKQSTVRR